MKLTQSKIESINKAIDEKKKANPMNHGEVGIGINVHDSIGGLTVFKNNWGVCTIEELGRMIEELTMVKEALEEECGIIL